MNGRLRAFPSLGFVVHDPCVHNSNNCKFNLSSQQHVRYIKVAIIRSLDEWDFSVLIGLIDFDAFRAK